jgi:hypothetical protein
MADAAQQPQQHVAADQRHVPLCTSHVTAASAMAGLRDACSRYWWLSQSVAAGAAAQVAAATDKRPWSEPLLEQLQLQIPCCKATVPLQQGQIL